MKRFLATMLTGVLLISSVPMGSYAATKETVEVTTSVKAEESAVDMKEPTDKGLEQAILAIKKKINIPAEYSEFNYYYYDGDNYYNSIWYLYWQNPKTNASIQVSCDEKYRITYYAVYDYDYKVKGIAKYLKDELRKTADDFIVKIAPETKNNLKFISAEYDGIYSGNYTYYYERKTNGIDFPDNKVTVSVNSVSGEVTSASINWIYDVTIPAANVKYTKDQAKELIKSNTAMRLVYKSNYIWIYDKNGQPEPRKAFLVYEPVDSYISIDAKTGEVYKSRSEWIDAGMGGSKSDEAEMATDSVANGLTPEEIKKVDELKNIISKSKAIEIITKNKYLYLDKNLQAYSATLQKRSDTKGKTSYVWNIILNDPREINYESESDYYRAYAYANVDAETGKILSFYATLRDNYDEFRESWIPVDIKYDKKAGREILEKFLKTQIKDRFESSVFVGDNNEYIMYYNGKEPVYGGYGYQYNRVNEGVEFPDNRIYGSVEGVTGKIYSYGSYWDENIVFESTKGAMTAEEAMDHYLNKEGYGLKYEINVINKYDSSYGNNKDLYDYTKAYSVEYKVRMVYRPDIYPTYISPFTGELLDYNGEVYTVTKPYSYKDIDNSEKYRNIRLLADMNIGFEGENFLPNQEITIGEVAKLLRQVSGYSLLGDMENNDSKVTREKLAQIFIAGLGMESISKLPGIYKTGYADEYNIDPLYLGAVALAKGLEIMEGDSNNYFNPKNTITRFDAVELIMGYINLQKSDLYY